MARPVARVSPVNDIAIEPEEMAGEVAGEVVPDAFLIPGARDGLDEAASSLEGARHGTV